MASVGKHRINIKKENFENVQWNNWSWWRITNLFSGFLFAAEVGCVFMFAHVNPHHHHPFSYRHRVNRPQIAANRHSLKLKLTLPAKPVA